MTTGARHHAHNNTTHMQYETKTQNTHRKTQINLHILNWAQCDKTQSREL